MGVAFFFSFIIVTHRHRSTPPGKRETRSVKDVVPHNLHAEKPSVNSGALLYDSAHGVNNTVLCVATLVHGVGYMLGGSSYTHTQKKAFMSFNDSNSRIACTNWPLSTSLEGGT